MKTINGQTNFTYEFTVDGHTVVKTLGEGIAYQNTKKDENNGVLEHDNTTN